MDQAQSLTRALSNAIVAHLHATAPRAQPRKSSGVGCPNALLGHGRLVRGCQMAVAGLKDYQHVLLAQGWLMRGSKMAVEGLKDNQHALLGQGWLVDCRSADETVHQVGVHPRDLWRRIGTSRPSLFNPAPWKLDLALDQPPTHSLSHARELKP